MRPLRPLAFLLALASLACAGSQSSNDDSWDEGTQDDDVFIEDISASCEGNVVDLEVEVRGDSAASVAATFYDEAEDLGTFDLDEGVSGSWFAEIDLGRDCEGLDVEVVATAASGRSDTEQDVTY